MSETVIKSDQKAMVHANIPGDVHLQAPPQTSVLWSEAPCHPNPRVGIQTLCEDVRRWSGCEGGASGWD